MNQDLIFALEAGYKLGTVKQETLINAYQQNPETVKMIDDKED